VYDYLPTNLWPSFVHLKETKDKSDERWSSLQMLKRRKHKVRLHLANLDQLYVHHVSLL
jgi:hypothetical protein